MKYLILLTSFIFLAACTGGGGCTIVQQGPPTTQPPVVTTTVAPGTTIPGPTTTQMPTGAVTCNWDFNTGSKNFANFAAVMATAKAMQENFCISFAGNNYCAVEGGCFGPCTACFPQGSVNVQKASDRSKSFKVNYPVYK